MELKLGKMKTKELAQWFGVSYSAFRKKAAARYEELKEFCEYTPAYGGPIINKIYRPVYIPKMKATEVMYEVIRDWPRNEPDTIKHKVMVAYKEHDHLEVKPDTLVNYGGIIKRDLYGKNAYIKRLAPGGSDGYAYYEFAKYYKGATEAEDRYVLLTPEEEETRLRIRKEIYSDKILDKAFDLMLYGQDNIEILEEIRKYKNFAKFKEHLIRTAEVLGCDAIKRATVVVDEISAFE